MKKANKEKMAASDNGGKGTTTATNKTTADKNGSVSEKKQTTQRKRRKDMPSVAYMMQHGNPERAHLPKTKMEIYGYPIVLAIIFAISL